MTFLLLPSTAMEASAFPGFRLAAFTRPLRKSIIISVIGWHLSNVCVRWLRLVGVASGADLNCMCSEHIGPAGDVTTSHPTSYTHCKAIALTKQINTNLLLTIYSLF